MTARENIELPLVHNLRGPDTVSKIETLAIRLNIEEVLDKFPNQLSGGENNGWRRLARSSLSPTSY